MVKPCSYLNEVLRALQIGFKFELTKEKHQVLPWDVSLTMIVESTEESCFITGAGSVVQ